MFASVSQTFSPYSNRQLAIERDLQSTCITSDNGCQILLYDTCKENSGTCVISIDDLHDSLTSVCGIILPKLTADNKNDQVSVSVCSPDYSNLKARERSLKRLFDVL